MRVFLFETEIFSDRLHQSQLEIGMRKVVTSIIAFFGVIFMLAATVEWGNLFEAALFAFKENLLGIVHFFADRPWGYVLFAVILFWEVGVIHLHWGKYQEYSKKTLFDLACPIFVLSGYILFGRVRIHIRWEEYALLAHSFKLGVSYLITYIAHRVLVGKPWQQT